MFVDDTKSGDREVLRRGRSGKPYSRSRLAKINLKLGTARTAIHSSSPAREIIVQPGREAGYEVSIMPPIQGRDPDSFTKVETAVRHALDLKAKYGFPIKSSGELA